MFYLATFYRVLFKAPLKSLLFVLLGVALVSGYAHKVYLGELVVDSMPKKGAPYFYALIDKRKNYHRISRWLRDLPGVDKVKVLSAKLVRDKAKKILTQTEMIQDGSLEKLDYAGLQVIFSRKLNSSSQNLVRDYLSKLAGKKDITIGAIKDRSDKLEEGTLMSFLRGHGVLAVLLLMSFLWILYALTFRHSLIKASYLLENFQRRRNVLPKIVAAGVSSIFVLGIGLSFVFIQPSLYWLSAALIPFLVVFLLYLRGLKWHL